MSDKNDTTARRPRSGTSDASDQIRSDHRHCAWGVTRQDTVDGWPAHDKEAGKRTCRRSEAPRRTQELEEDTKRDERDADF